MCVGVREIERERVPVSHIQTNIREILDLERRIFVTAREKDISQRE